MLRDAGLFALVSYQMTVTNNGNQAANSNVVVANYEKPGSNTRFRNMTWGTVPALTPGQSATLDVKVRFKDSVFTDESGTIYDNVLVAGSSAIRFYTLYNEQSLGNATYTQPISYADAGGPVFNYILLQAAQGGNRNGAPRGANVEIAASIQDDLRTERAVIEYRLNPQSVWVSLDDYTGNTTQTMRFGQSNHSGATVSTPTSNGTVTWAIPTNFPLTSTLEIRITAYDNQGNAKFGISPLFRIFDDTLIVNAGTTDSPAYRIGDQVKIPVTVITPMIVGYYKVVYHPSPDRSTQDLLSVTGDGISSLAVPPVLTVTLPSTPYYASDSGYLEVTVGASSGVGSRNVSDVSDNNFVVNLNDFPAPFNASIVAFSGNYPFPANTYYRTSDLVPITAVWDGDTTVHVLYSRTYGYNYSSSFNGTYDVSGKDYYHVTYNRLTGVVTKSILPPGYEYDDVEVFAGMPYFLMRSGVGLYWTWGTGGSYVNPQFLFNLSASGNNTSAPEFQIIGSELFVSYSTRNDTDGSNSTTWRSRLLRLLPSQGSVIEHPLYLNRSDYGVFLNGRQGIFALDANHQITSPPLVSFYGNQVYFSSLNTGIVGASQSSEGGRQILDYYTPSGVATRWDILAQDVRIKAFDSFIIGIGQGTSQSLPGENGFSIVSRRNLNTNAEERIKFAYGQFDEIGRRSAITDSKWVAIVGGRTLAVGYFGGDLVAPSVQLTTTDTSYVTGQSKSFAWTMGDNLNQLASVKVLKVVGGVSTQLANYTSGTLPTTLNYTFNDTAASIIVRVEAYDQSGNRGVSEKVLTRSSAFSFSSFTATSYSVAMGTSAALQWTATPADAFRIYNILTRPQGGTAWVTAGSVTGAAFLLDTSLLSGMQEVRLESGGEVRDLPQPITITGNRFAFDNSQFAPTGNVFVSSVEPSVSLNWGSNQAVSLGILYTVLGRWNNAGSYVILGSTTEKSLLVSTGSNTSLQWKVVAASTSEEFASSVRTVSLLPVGAAGTPILAVGGRATSSPWVDITLPIVAGSEGTVIFRRNTQTDQVEELARVTTGSYRDEEVVFGNSFTYTLANLLGGNVLAQGAGASVTVEPALPVGISFVNPSNQSVAGVGNTIRWNPALPAGVTAVYENYEVTLRRGDGVVITTDVVRSVSGATAQVAYAGLGYNQSYVVEVFARHPNGTRLGNEPARLFFSTGFDRRGISSAPQVTKPIFGVFGANLSWSEVANADYYDIFRKTKTGLVWVGRSESTGFLDETASHGDSVSYVVRARNANTFVDSVPSKKEVFSVFEAVTGGYTGPITSQPSAFLLTGIAKANVTLSGAFTAKIGIGPKAYSLKGDFDETGAFSGSLKRGRLAPLGVSLNVDLANGTGAMTGEISDGSGTMLVDAWKGVKYSRTSTAQEEGSYNFALEPGAEFGTPNGYGIGTIKVSRAGGVKVKGILANGAKMSAGTFITEGERFPLYSVLDKGQGSLSAFMAFADKSDSDIDAVATWFSGRERSVRYSFDAFTTEPRIFAQRYTAPERGERAVLDSTNGAGTLSLASGATTLTQGFTLGTDNRFTYGSPLLDGFAMTLSAKKGEFSGSLRLGGEKTKFSGVLMQKSDEGVGFSMGGDLRVELGP